MPSLFEPASANVEITPAYEAPFKASIACLIGLGSPPTVSVSGNIVTIFVAAQLVSLNVACNVTVKSPSTHEVVIIPVTIQSDGLQHQTQGDAHDPHHDSVQAAGPLDRRQHAGANGQVTVFGSGAPYRASVACPAGTNLSATAFGDRVSVVSLGRSTQTSDCMVTVSTRSGLLGANPVHVSGSLGPIPSAGVRPPGPANGLHLDRANLALHPNERQSAQILGGTGPFQVSGCDRIATVRVDGNAITAIGKTPGACSLTVRASAGTTLMLPISVESGSPTGPSKGGVREPVPVAPGRIHG